jgi:hypothetical protein
MLLFEIGGEQISRYQRQRLKAGVSNRKINIEVTLLRLVLRKAKLRKAVRVFDQVGPETESPQNPPQLAVVGTRSIM